MNPLSRLLLAVACLLTACDASPPPAPSHSSPSASRASSLVVRSDSEPSLQLLSSSLDFASQRVCGTGAMKKLEVGNNSTQPRKISFLVADAPFEVKSLEDVSGNPLTLPVNLNANQGMYVWVNFNPRTPGALSGTLTVFSDDPVNNGLLAVNLTGRGTGPYLEVSPATLTLSLNAAASSSPDAGSPTDAGTASDAGTAPSPQGPFLGTVRLRNTGNEVLTTLALRALGPDFTADLGPKTSLIAGDSTDVTVTYAPTSTSGPWSKDTLKIDNSGPCDAAQVSLTGFRSPGPVLELDRNTLAFAEQEVGSNSAAQFVTVSNAGGAPLTVTPVLTPSSTAPFVVSPGGSFTLQPRESLPLSVRFIPTAAGVGQTATLQLNGNGTPSSASVTLSGDAVVAASVDVTPAVVRFLPTVPGETRVQEITLENKGTSPVTLSTSITSTPSPSPFSVNAPRITVNPQGSAKLNVTLSVPTGASAGVWSGQLVLATGSSGSARQISVPLHGEAKSQIVPTTTTVQFSDQSVEAEAQKQTLILTNRSAVSVKVNEVSGELGPFSITDLPKEIPAGGSLAVPIFFKPDSRKLWEVSLQLTSTATEAIVPVLLRGQATAPELTIPTASLELDFGTQAPGTTTARRATLNNSGDAELTVRTITPAETGNYTIQDLQLPRKVPAKGSLSFDVFFTPKDRGTKKTSIQFAVGTSTQPLVSPVINVKGESTGPSVALVPKDELSFGNQRAQDTKAVLMKVQIGNQSGAETLRILSVDFVNKTPGFSLGASIVNQECAGGDMLNAEVLFQPTVVGKDYTDELIIRYQGTLTKAPQEAKIKITGSGQTSLISLSPESLEFGSVSVGTPGVKKLILTNTGKTPLQLMKLDITNDPDKYFKYDPLPWPKSIAPGGTEDITVRFFASKEVSTTANLEITSNSSVTGGDAKTASIRTVSLSGQGASPRAVFSQKTFVLDETPVGQSSSTELEVTNHGSAPLVFNKPLASAHFTVKGPPSWPHTIPAVNKNGETSSFTFKIYFTPDSTDLETETIDLKSNDTKEPGTLTLNGVGTRPTLDVAPALGIDFKEVELKQDSDLKDVSLSNSGKAPLDILAISVDAPFCFIVPGTTECIRSTTTPLNPVQPNTSMVLKVRARPTTETSESRTLTISTNEAATGGSPGSAQRSVPLKVLGTGNISIQATTLQFGYRGVGQPPPGGDQGVTISNTTTTPVQVKQVDIVMISSDGLELKVKQDFKVKSAQPLTIPSNGSEKLEFTFAPEERTETERIAIAKIYTTKNSVVPVPLRLEGTVARPKLSVTRADEQPFQKRLDFPQTLINSTSRSIFLKLANSEDVKGPLTITASIKGNDSNSFSLESSEVRLNIEPGKSANLAVQFAPKSGIKRYGALLSLSTTDSDQKSLEYDLSGDGIDSALSVLPTVLNYGTIIAGAQTSTLKVQLTNNSGQQINITNAELSGANSSHFTLNKVPTKEVPFTIGPNEKYELPVVFHPQNNVDSSASLKITVEGALRSEFTVQLNGSGRESIFKDLKTELNFGAQRLQEQAKLIPLPLYNNSDKTILVQYGIEGSQAGNFTVEVDPSCSKTDGKIQLGPKVVCSLILSHSTQRVVYSKDAALVLKVSASDGGGLVTERQVTLEGETASNFMTVDPMEVDFEWVDLGQELEPRLITVTNQSKVALTVLPPEVTNPSAFTVEALKPGGALLPGDSTQLRVTFHPQEGGEATGELRLHVEGQQATDVAILLKGQVRAIGGEGGAHACGASPQGAILSGGWLLMLLGLSERRRTRGTSA